MASFSIFIRRRGRSLPCGERDGIDVRRRRRERWTESPDDGGQGGAVRFARRQVSQHVSTARNVPTHPSPAAERGGIIPRLDTAKRKNAPRGCVLPKPLVDGGALTHARLFQDRRRQEDQELVLPSGR